MNMSSKPLPEFTTGGFFGNNANTAVNWTADGKRYHIWFDLNREWSPGSLDPKWLPRRELLNMGGERIVRLYVNPPLGLKSGAEGYFNTRRLYAEAPKWAAIFEAAQAFVNSGEPERISAERVRREEIEAAQRAAEETEAHGTKTKERLDRFAAELHVAGHTPAANHLYRLTELLTNAQADRLSAYVHDLVQP